MINKLLKKLLIKALSLTFCRYALFLYAEPITKEVKKNLDNLNKNYLKSAAFQGLLRTFAVIEAIND